MNGLSERLRDFPVETLHIGIANNSRWKAQANICNENGTWSVFSHKAVVYDAAIQSDNKTMI